MPAKPAAPAPDSATRRFLTGSAAVLLAGALLPLAGCSSSGGDSSGDAGGGGGARDVPQVGRDHVASGGTMRWAVDEVPHTLNTFQADADAATNRIAGATLPALFTLDARGRPQPNADYLRSADITERRPRQTVVYKLDPKARWNSGRPLSAADFAAQWKALRGSDDSYEAARNAGYDRVQKVTKGPHAHEVKVVFRKPYADWKSLFSPLYPKSVMGDPHHFSSGARRKLPESAGPFRVKSLRKGATSVFLERDPKWWGNRAKLRRIELRAVPAGQRRAALGRGELDLADIDTGTLKRIADARGSGNQNSDAQGDAKAGARHGGREGHRAAAATRGRLGEYAVRRALDPAYTQLALNGATGPLSDERVRRAVARALDRDAIAKKAFSGTGLPAKPLGSHLRMQDQDGYADNSGALGGKDLESAQSLLADAGWQGGVGGRGGAGGDVDAKKKGGEGDDKSGKKDDGSDGGKAEGKAKGGKAAGGAGPVVRMKGGKPLQLRFVVPSSPGSEQERATGKRIARSLSAIGIRARVTSVPDSEQFTNRLNSGDFDLALYAWPATAYPATDARPVFAKPEASGGSLVVEQNYTRVGTDQIDQLFDQAAGELDDRSRNDLIRRADARIWAAAGSVPLYQRPQLVAARDTLANAGAFGFQTPRYQDIGFEKK